MLKAFLILFLLLLIPQLTYARTTPEDINNQRRDIYNSAVKNYSPQSKQKLEDFNRKIASLNQSQSARLEDIMIRQGEILDEYIQRKGIPPVQETDGIKRDLADPVENARYWITYAHEAVAYQAAHIYIFNLTGESNVNKDITSQINLLASDMSVLKNKVEKSQTILEQLLKK